MPVEQPKETRQFASVQEWEMSHFKNPASRKERVTHVYTRTVIWLVEDGVKIRQIQDQSNTNTTVDTLSHGSPKTFDDYIDRDAVNYANDTILSYNEKMPESYGSMELWEQMIYNQLIRQTLNYISKYLTYLKGQDMGWCVLLADKLLGKLQDTLLTFYNQSDDRQKELFKERMKKHFPNSQILKEIN